MTAHRSVWANFFFFFFSPLPSLFFIFLSTVGSWYLTKSTVICKGVVPSLTSKQCREEKKEKI